MESGSLADIAQLQALARLVRFQCLTHTPVASSAHLTASLATADLMTGLLFGGSFRFDFASPAHPDNDQLIIADGATAPLSDALWSVATRATETPSPPPWFRSSIFSSSLLGQTFPTGARPPAGSVARNEPTSDAGRSPRRVFVLFDGHTITESARGEALHFAARQRIPGLTGIISITRKSRRSVKGAISRDLAAYARRIAASGWRALVIDGHDFPQILDAFREATAKASQPAIVIARTLISDDLSFLDEHRPGQALDADSWAHALAALDPAGHEIPASARAASPGPGRRVPAQLPL